MHPGHLFERIGELTGNGVSLVVEKVNVGEKKRSTCLLNGERENLLFAPVAENDDCPKMIFVES